MPRPDPIPSPRHSMIRRFVRVMRWMAAFAIVVNVDRETGRVLGEPEAVEVQGDD